MGLCVVFVSGPRRAGKSSLIRAMLDRIWKIEPHYIRLVERGGDKAPPTMPSRPPSGCGVATARTIEYDADRIYEVLPQTLTAIHRQDRFGAVIIEADADPVLRCAFDYNHRVFIMPVPPTVETVFRSTVEAAQQLRRMMDDTAAFASNIFGLLGVPELDDDGPKMRRPQMTPAQLSNFLHSPLGDELATQMALQPAYHGMLESEVVLINRVAGNGRASDDCVRRIGQLLDRMGRCAKRKSELFMCDPFDLKDKNSRQLFKSLKAMCIGGT